MNLYLVKPVDYHEIYVVVTVYIKSTRSISPQAISTHIGSSGSAGPSCR